MEKSSVLKKKDDSAEEGQDPDPRLNVDLDHRLIVGLDHLIVSLDHLIIVDQDLTIADLGLQPSAVPGHQQTGSLNPQQVLDQGQDQFIVDQEVQ